MTMADTPFVQTWHAENLMAFSYAANGNRNDLLNEKAFDSFRLALNDESKLSVAQVQSDYSAAAVALGLDKNEIQKSIQSALAGAKAKPRNLSINRPLTPKISKSDLMLAPTYTALEDYALAHGVPVSAFQEAKWTEGIHNGRPCLFVPHEDGIVRVRFLDGEQPKWLPIKPDGMTDKIVPCWYGFKRAIDMAKEADHKTLALCNGQPSVITAQYYGIAALAQTDGEGKKIEQPLLKRLLAAVKEHELKIIVAMDGDDTGRNATKDRQAQLQANGIPVSIVYFGGDDGYDLADYCK